MRLISGISKTLKKQFIVDEDALIRMKGILDKAACSLDHPVQVVFHVEREDDRFYETTELKDVISDPNIAEKKIILVGIEIRKDKNEKESHRDWIARIVFVKDIDKTYTIDKIQLDISTEDKSWALLLADELEPQIDRTINRSKVPGWPLIGIGLFGVYILIRLYCKFNLNLRMSEFLIPVMVSGGFFLPYVLLCSLDKSGWLRKLLGPESVFLWGDEEKRFREREQMRRNLFWGVVVAFIVSVISTIIVTVL